MDTLTIVLLLSYLLAAFLSIAGITISLLARQRGRTSLNNAIIVFLFGMLAMCGYDWFIYFTNYAFHGVSSTLLMRLGACLISLIFAAWVKLEQRMISIEVLSGPTFFFRVYALAYSCVWLVITLFIHSRGFYAIKFLLLCSDILLLIMMLALSVAYISKLLLDGRKMEPAYMIIVSTMLAWNYISFIWGEMSVYWGNSAFIREPLDFTIIFWLAVNIATIFFVYKVDFALAYEVEAESAASTAKTFDLDAVLEEMHGSYNMTKRETDILRLVYQGLSNMEIAEKLFISKSTVKSHIYNAFRKANVRSRSEIIVLMHEIGMGEGLDGAAEQTEPNGHDGQAGQNRHSHAGEDKTNGDRKSDPSSDNDWSCKL